MYGNWDVAREEFHAERDGKKKPVPVKKTFADLMKAINGGEDVVSFFDLVNEVWRNVISPSEAIEKMDPAAYIKYRLRFFNAQLNPAFRRRYKKRFYCPENTTEETDEWAARDFANKLISEAPQAYIRKFITPLVDIRDEKENFAFFERELLMMLNADKNLVIAELEKRKPGLWHLGLKVYFVEGEKGYDLCYFSHESKTMALARRAAKIFSPLKPRGRIAAASRRVLNGMDNLLRQLSV